MTGMFGRLANQAKAGSGPERSRIRPASVVHAPVPLSSAREPEVPLMTAPAHAVEEVLADPVVATTGVSHLMASSVPGAHQAPLAPATSPAGAQPTQVLELNRVIVRDMQANERTRDVPAPLLAESPPPPLVPFSVAPFVGAPRERSNDPSVRRGEPTEVHVHIGRIEVTGAPEPAPAKRPKPAAPRETLPLADYLSRKSRP